MTSRSGFEMLLTLETTARDLYVKLLEDLRNPEIRRAIEEIRDDEERHIELARRLVVLASKR